MKFYLAEGNIGADATRQQVDHVIEALREKGWDVEYGLAENKATDISDFGQEERLQDSFADDFMTCLDTLGIE
jgi:hypothetical protein